MFYILTLCIKQDEKTIGTLQVRTTESYIQAERKK